MSYHDFEKTLLALTHFPRLTPMEVLLLYTIYIKGPCPVFYLLKKLPNYSENSIRKRLSLMKEQGSVTSQLVKAPRLSRVPIACYALTEQGTNLILEIIGQCRTISDDHPDK